jgi:hypothetical protein
MGTLQTITHAAAQGQTILTEGIPADATMEGIYTTTTNTPTTQKDPAPADKGEKGALYESPLPVFDGDTTKTKAFSLAIKGGRTVNWRKAVIRNPYTRTALILNFIRGKNIDD